MKDSWISIDDRFPAIDERVMVYIRNPDDRHNNIELAYLSYETDDEFPYWVFDNKSRFYSTRFRYVTHWQPLPKPPVNE